MAKQRGEQAKACRWWREALLLYQEIGATPMVERVSGWIKDDCP